MPVPKRKRSTFLYSTDAGSVLSLLFDYLNGSLSKTFTQREGKRRGLDAMSAFWMPYALRHKQADPLELKQTARSSVEILSRQIRAICQDFAIESPLEMAYSGVSPEAVVQALKSRVEPSATAIVGGDRPSVSPDSIPLPDPIQDIIFVDDEDLLGDLN